LWHNPGPSGNGPGGLMASQPSRTKADLSTPALRHVWCSSRRPERTRSIQRVF